MDGSSSRGRGHGLEVPHGGALAGCAGAVREVELDLQAVRARPTSCPRWRTELSSPSTLRRTDAPSASARRTTPGTPSRTSRSYAAGPRVASTGQTAEVENRAAGTHGDAPATPLMASPRRGYTMPPIIFTRSTPRDVALWSWGAPAANPQSAASIARGFANVMPGQSSSVSETRGCCEMTTFRSATRTKRLTAQPRDRGGPGVRGGGAPTGKPRIGYRKRRNSTTPRSAPGQVVPTAHHRRVC